MARLYRATTSDLALAQRDFPRSEVTLYLNQLVARAHALVYRSEPLAVKRLWHFATISFPRLFRETWIFTFVAALFFILPGIVSGVVTYLRPESATLLLPPETHSSDHDRGTQGVMDRHPGGRATLHRDVYHAEQHSGFVPCLRKRADARVC